MEHHYIVPAAFLSAALCIGGLFAYRTARNVAVEQRELDARTAELAAVSTRTVQQKNVLLHMRGSAAPANSFMTHWHAALAPGRDANAMLTDFSRFGNEQAVSVQNRKSGSVEYFWKGKPLHVQSAEGEGVSSEYYRLINWLGEVEHAWPIARFEQATFEQRGTSLRLFVRLSYPTFLTDAATK